MQIPIREKYDPKAPQWTNIYVLIHFAVAVVAIEHMGKMSVSRTAILNISNNIIYIYMNLHIILN